MDNLTNFNYEEGYFKTNDNLKLYRQSWHPQKMHGIFYLVHGLGEHSGRYGNLREYFLPKGWAIFSYDQRGFGRSEGKRGHVNTFQDYLMDLQSFINLTDSALQPEGKNLKKVLIGHSMGGLIVLAFCLQHSPKINGVITSGAALALSESVPKVKIFLGRIISTILPQLALPNEIDPKSLSHDKKVVEDYVKDPLVHRKLTARLGTELIRAMGDTLVRAPGLSLPAMILHGMADPLVPCKGSEEFYGKIRCKNKELKLYPGFYHEIFNELGKEKVFGDMELWLEQLP